MLNSLEIESALSALGLTECCRKEHIVGYEHGDLKHRIYVKRPSGTSTSQWVSTSPLVIHMEYMSARKLIDRIDGVVPNWEKFYKNSNMVGFVKRWGSLVSGSPFGVAVNVQSRDATSALVAILMGMDNSADILPLGNESEAQIERRFAQDVEAAKARSRESRLRRLSTACKTPERIVVIKETFRRNPDVVAEVLHRAGGSCEGCRNPAPFIRMSDQTPYLEVHHLVQLADNGDDSVENAIALCPNCHRKSHFGIAVSPGKLK